MSRIAFTIFSFCLQTAMAQPAAKKATTYLSISPGFVAPLGVLDDTYYGGLLLHGIAHFKWVGKNAEVQAITGYERFMPKGLNNFGAISTIPIKLGMLQTISREFFLTGHVGAIAVKDAKTKFNIRPAADFGIGYAFNKFAFSVAINGWVRKLGSGNSNYFSAGIIFPYKRGNW